MAVPIILVVEPSPDYRSVLRTFLEREGYGVVCPAEAAEALREARRLRPAVILGEHPLRLPDGRLLCDALREDPETREIPFLAVTSRAFPEELEGAAAAHGGRVYIKPVEHATLLSDIAALSGRGE